MPSTHNLAALALLGLSATTASAQVAQHFGEEGASCYRSYLVNGGGRNGREPTIGVNWNTDSVFYHSSTVTYRAKFDTSGINWFETPNTFSVTNVDPMMHVDEVTGRIWAGGLAGPCSTMGISDDDGETWIPAGDMCTYAQFDHQTIGSGPPNPNAVVQPLPIFPHMTYYCSQLVTTACITSLDGGIKWGPPQQVLGACGGLHGHVRVNPVTGTAVVPHKGCDGFGYTEDNGLTWNSRIVEGANIRGTVFDPSVGFGRQEGWLYYGHGGLDGAFMALSKDDGRSWEKIGPNKDTTWLDVGQFHDPPIVRATWSDVQAGDDDRAAFAFFGLLDTDGDDTAAEFIITNNCLDGQEAMIWHYYVAVTYDGATTWNVQRFTNNPAQIGGMCVGQCSPCRNLLDFNDMDIDSKGRIYVGWGDGCEGDCEFLASPGSSGFRADRATLTRQETGRGLFAEFDNDVSFVDANSEETNTYCAALDVNGEPRSLNGNGDPRASDVFQPEAPLNNNVSDDSETEGTVEAAEFSSSSSSSSSAVDAKVAAPVAGVSGVFIGAAIAGVVGYALHKKSVKVKEALARMGSGEQQA